MQRLVCNFFSINDVFTRSLGIFLVPGNLIFLYLDFMKFREIQAFAIPYLDSLTSLSNKFTSTERLASVIEPSRGTVHGRSKESKELELEIIEGMKKHGRWRANNLELR